MEQGFQRNTPKQVNLVVVSIKYQMEQHPINLELGLMVVAVGAQENK